MSGDRPTRRRPGDRAPAERDQAPRPASESAQPGATGGEIAGLVGEAAATRGGEDSRRRGWFWHWNSIVTQFAPLIGLKGVGLLNSYTVWTDRREESPHRGYAFPSQQSEAAFYGEDRAELIAINKLLVALDLIEIRKEMVLRTDEQGRRWRVPHNFYRVKDHADGFNLTTERVLRVVELADREAAVYRLVRHVFSERFAPIDADNPWGRVLPELRQTPTWQRLAARVAAEEERATARTRAGHAARAKRPVAPDEAAESPFFVPKPGATPTTTPTSNDSVGVEKGVDLETAVAATNRGLTVDVAGANNGSTTPNPIAVGGGNEGSPGDVPGTNNGRPTGVGPLNRTYHQDPSTTTTTTNGPKQDEQTTVIREAEPVTPMQDLPVATDRPVPDRPATVTAEHTNGEPVDRPAASFDRSGTAGPGGRPAPTDAPGEASAVRAFEDANARRSTPAERQILRGLAERYHEAARAADATGWSWLTDAIFEAVEAGSAYVAPRRVREILTRWEREGRGRRADGETDRRADDRRDEWAETERRAEAPPARGGRVEDLLGAGRDFPLPHGFGSRATWAFAVGLLSSALAPDRLTELVAGTAIAGYRDGEVTVSAPDPVQAERLATTYRDLVARKLSEAMRRPVRLAVLTEAADQASAPESVVDSVEPIAAAPTEASIVATGGEDPAPAVFMVPECGLPSFQVWAAVLAELQARGDVTRANVDAWLRPTSLIGRGSDGAFVVGAPHELARKRIAARFLPPLRAAVAAVTGARLPVEVVVAREWVRANNGGSDEFAATDEVRRGA